MNAQQPPASAHERQARALFDRHVAAFSAGDLDAVLGDFDTHALVITADGVFAGRQQIRTVYAALLAEFGVIARGDSPGLTLDTLHVRDDTIFIAWHAESKHHVYPFGTDTFICRGGHFVRQSIAFTPPRPRDAAAG